MSGNNKRWIVKSSKEIMKAGFFRLRCDELELPGGKIQPRYYTIEFSDWVNVVALTDKNELIIIKQYRPPVEEYCLEIPGGATHQGIGEEPSEAARRELEEETGYVAREIKLVGSHDPNPALQTNKLWTFLALGCVKTKDQNLDPYEQIEVDLVPVKDVYEMAHRGEIRHSLVLTALFLARPHLQF